MSVPCHYNSSQHDASLPGKKDQSSYSPSYYDGSEQQGYYPPQGLYGQHQQQQGYHNYPPAQPCSIPQDQQKHPSYSGNPYTYPQSGYATAYGDAPSHPPPEQPGNQGYYDQNPQSQASYPRNAGSSSSYPPQQQPYQSAGPSRYGPLNEADPQMGQSIVRPPPPNGGKKGKRSKISNMSGGGIGHGLLGAAGGALAGVAGTGLVSKLRKKRRNHKYSHRRGSRSGSGSCSGSSCGSSSSSATSDSSSSNSY